jgi:signal transduction histidine kinase
VYRIVQESLTNAVRHAAASSVTVTLREGEGSVEVTVDDDGQGPPTPVREGGGSGLLGMRERAELQGGTFSAGPRSGGGFRVQAVLPISERVPR